MAKPNVKIAAGMFASTHNVTMGVERVPTGDFTIGDLIRVRVGLAPVRKPRKAKMAFLAFTDPCTPAQVANGLRRLAAAIEKLT